MYVGTYLFMSDHIQTHADAYYMTGMITSTAFPTRICGVLDECPSLSELMHCLKGIYDNIEINTFRKAIDIHNDDLKHDTNSRDFIHKKTTTTIVSLYIIQSIIYYLFIN